jgi:4-hydroxybenzoate polyprenyltransferase
MAPVPGRSTRGAYLALLRPANVVTALADVLAGAAVAGDPWSASLSWLLGSTACLYAGGVVMNDYVDRTLDAVERPERPIPSGAVSAAAARRLGLFLLAAGVTLSAFVGQTSLVTAGGLALAILLYDELSKRHAFAGPLNMGACRGLNLMLGMTIAPGALAEHAGLGLLPLAYIAGVTVLSRGEVAGGKRPVALLAFALVGSVIGAAGWISLHGGKSLQWWAPFLVLVMAYRVLPPYWAAWQAPDPVRIRAAVRRGVLSLALLDAVIAAAYADIMVSLAVLATAFLAGWLARQFAVT